MVEVNSKKSYLGRDIRKWCFSTESADASDIKQKYYSEEVKFKPNDKAYYFVECKVTTDLYKGLVCRLIRDSEKSPKNRVGDRFDFESSFVDANNEQVLSIYCESKNMCFTVLTDLWDDPSKLYFSFNPMNKREEEKFRDQLFKYLKDTYSEYFE